MMRSFVIVIAGAAMAGIVGCATTSTGVSDMAKKAVEESADAIVTGDWELRFIAKGKEKQDMPNAVTMTVSNIGNNRYEMAGFAGVNTFKGSLTIGANGAITVDKNIALTRMAGPEDIMSAERMFLDAVRGATSWKAVKVGAETMEMYGEYTLCFTRLTIKDRIWNLSAQLDDGGSAIISLPSEGRKVTLMLSDKANIFTGLNITNTEYTLDEAAHKLSIAIASGAMTLASGSDGEMERERLYLKNLDAVASYSVSGKELFLLDASGKAVLVFTAQDLL